MKLCVLIFLDWTSRDFRHEAILSTGGNSSGAGGSASYSIGQVTYNTYAGTSGIASQGVQQPFEILVVTGIEEAFGITLKSQHFPNPTSDFLYLKIDASTTLSIQSMSYQLFDINGKLLESNKVEGNLSSISMENTDSCYLFFINYG